MTFTTQPPTVPGAYYWKLDDDSDPQLLDLKQFEDRIALKRYGLDHDHIGGYWSERLVPVSEVGKAYREGLIDGVDSTTDEITPSIASRTHCEALIHGCYHGSHARKVVEGEV
jgi:hypothetical protein